MYIPRLLVKIITHSEKYTVFPWTVGHSAILKNLQEFIHDRRVSLLYLVEKQYRKRRVPYCVRELTSRLVAHVSRRRSKQLLVAVRLAVLAHIEPDTAAIVAEKLRRKRLCGLGFTRAGRSCKEKYSLWPGVGASLESGKSGHCALYHVKRAYYRRVLTLHAAAEVLLGAAQLLYVKAAPRILTNAVFVEVDNSAHVLHRKALVLTELPQTVQLREAETLGQRPQIAPEPREAHRPWNRTIPCPGGSFPM